MIPQAYINEWRAFSPWSTEAQIEQDLILSRAIIEIFSEPSLAKALAFRGGTALHKLFIQPPARYSEDIDLVQINEGAIGTILETLRKQLNPWLGEPRWKLNTGRATLIYRFSSESYPVTPMRLKIEINTREHFAVLDFQQKPYEIKSSWFSNSAIITTYTLEELLGTKLRALYQRKKGRDLFDLAVALNFFPTLEIPSLIQCFNHYVSLTKSKVSRAEFEANLAEKISDTAFMNDIAPLLSAKAHTNYESFIAINNINEKVIALLPGEAWKQKNSV